MKEEMEMNNDHLIGFGIGLATGLVIGGVIALLFAPKTGAETRQLIRDKASGVVDAIKDKSTGVVQALKS
jgi:gas vesicle protein